MSSTGGRRRLANALAQEGVTGGGRIAVLSTTRPEYAEVYVAAAKLGLTVVALNVRMHVEELVYCIERSRAVAAARLA